MCEYVVSIVNCFRLLLLAGFESNWQSCTNWPVYDAAVLPPLRCRILAVKRSTVSDIPSPDTSSLHSLSPTRTSEGSMRHSSSVDDLLSEGQVVRVTMDVASTCNYKSIVVSDIVVRKILTWHWHVPIFPQVQKSDRTSTVIRTALDKYDVAIATSKCQLLQVLPDTGESVAPALNVTLWQVYLCRTLEDLLIPNGATVYYALASIPNEHSPLLRIHIPS